MLESDGGRDDCARIVQHWAGRTVPISENSRPLFRRPIAFGVVIGTYAALPYVHLQLEAWQRFYPHVRLLVHDDASVRQNELQELCEYYGCDFEVNARRMPQYLGDISAFYGGLLWAEDRGVDLLVKISRRWLFLLDWTRSLEQLALDSQYATFSNYTKTFSFGFRTECTGMSVRHWTESHVFQSMESRIAAGQPVFVEHYIHQFARAFESVNSPTADAWRSQHPVPHEYSGYAAWDLMGCDRGSAEPEGTHLWHDFHRPSDYARVAREWDLPYSERDFADPNEGGGIGGQ